MTGRSRQGLHATGRALAGLVGAIACLLFGTAGLQDVNANGDTRTLDLYHEHTKESASITYRQNGRYSSEGLRQLNWLLRDWRIDEQISMDPKLFDIVWQVYRESRATGPIHVNSAYRSPQTNAALRRRSRGVAQFSQHMRGKAMDFFLEGVPMARVREIGLRLQHGGVGFYPHSRHQFVHLDAGGVRSWPRLPDAHLARLSPDGRTVHIPQSGQPLAGYEEAKAAILARGGTVAGFTTYAEEGGGRRKSFWARLFGGGEDEDEDMAAPGMSGRSQVASAGTNDADGGVRGFFSFFGGGNPAPQPAAAPSPPPEPITTTASLPPVGQGGAAPIPTPPPVLAPPIVMPLPPRRPAEFASFVGAVPTRAAPAKAAPAKTGLAKTGPAKEVLAKGAAKAAPARSNAKMASGGLAAVPPSLPKRGEMQPPGRKPPVATQANDKMALRSLLDAKHPKARAAFSSTKIEAPRAGVSKPSPAVKAAVAGPKVASGASKSAAASRRQTGR